MSGNMTRAIAFAILVALAVPVQSKITDLGTLIPEKPYRVMDSGLVGSFSDLVDFKIPADGIVIYDFVQTGDVSFAVNADGETQLISLHFHLAHLGGRYAA